MPKRLPSISDEHLYLELLDNIRMVKIWRTLQNELSKCILNYEMSVGH